MKLIAALLSTILIAAPFSMAKAECEKEAKAVIKRYLSKRGVNVSKFASLRVKGLTPGSYWQRYNVRATVVTSDGRRLRLGFIMSSPFICDDLSIESVLR